MPSITHPAPCTENYSDRRRISRLTAAQASAECDEIVESGGTCSHDLCARAMGMSLADFVAMEERAALKLFALLGGKRGVVGADSADGVAITQADYSGEFIESFRDACLDAREATRANDRA